MKLDIYTPWEKSLGKKCRHDFSVAVPKIVTALSLQIGVGPRTESTCLAVVEVSFALAENNKKINGELILIRTQSHRHFDERALVF